MERHRFPWSAWICFLLVFPQGTGPFAEGTGPLWKTRGLSPAKCDLSPSCSTSIPHCPGSSILDLLNKFVDLVERLWLFAHLLGDFLHCVYGGGVVSAPEYSSNVGVAQLGQLSEDIH